jgi:Predicted membrane protein (DUF2142)
VRWQQRTTRDFLMPAELGFPAFSCVLFEPRASANCLDRGRSTSTKTETSTHVGTYQPYAYLAPGLAMRVTRDPIAAMRLGRLVNAILSLGLVALAAFALWDRSRGALSLAGFFVALTPAVVYFSTAMNPSGPEIASGLCFSASLLRLSRSSRTPSWLWALFAGSGAVLALSRSLGPLFVGLALLVVAGLVGPRRLTDAARTAPRKAAAALGTVILAMAAGVVWELRYQPHPPSDLASVADEVEPSARALPQLAKEAVGVFGPLDTPMFLSAYITWWLMLGVLVMAALAVSPTKRRLSLVALALAIPAVTIAVSTIYRQTGFALQGRYVLPFAVLLPLWAGELLNRPHRALRPDRSRALIACLATAAAAIHALAWYTNSRRAAVGTDGGWLFSPDAEWVPPLGWLPWIVVVLVATGLYTLAGLRAARAPVAARRSAS